MPSSTFSSEQHAESNWGASFALAFVIVLACVGSWELFWRNHGFVPSVTDDAGLWALTRYRANALGEDAVVLVGSSRMQMDVQRNALARATGWPPALQLAVVRGPSVPVLENLASDPDFRGTVICEVNPVLFFAETPNVDQMLDSHFQAFREFSIGSHVEQRLSMWFQRSFVTRLPDLALGEIREAARFGQLPRPSYNAVVSENRFRFGDFSKFMNLRRANRQNARRLKASTPKVMEPSRFAERLRLVDSYVEAIRERGGNVVFVRLPSSMHVLEHERRFWKRSDYWDKLVLATNAESVHYEDYPGLRDFVAPDGDHLGQAAAISFTSELGRILVNKGIHVGSRQANSSPD